jgi:hypothetical protein
MRQTSLVFTFVSKFFCAQKKMSFSFSSFSSSSSSSSSSISPLLETKESIIVKKLKQNIVDCQCEIDNHKNAVLQIEELKQRIKKENDSRDVTCSKWLETIRNCKAIIWGLEINLKNETSRANFIFNGIANDFDGSTNDRLVKLQKKIKEQKDILAQKEQCFEEEKQLLTNIVDNSKLQLEKLTSQTVSFSLTKIEEKILKFNYMIVEEAQRLNYEEYAKNNNIDFPSLTDPTKNIFQLCNQHHHNELLCSGFFQEGGCGGHWKRGGDNRHDYESDDDNGYKSDEYISCSGWWTNKDSCECRYTRDWVWIESEKMNNLEFFTIYSKSPLGYAKLYK